MHLEGPEKSVTRAPGLLRAQVAAGPPEAGAVEPDQRLQNEWRDRIFASDGRSGVLHGLPAPQAPQVGASSPLTPIARLLSTHI